MKAIRRILTKNQKHIEKAKQKIKEEAKKGVMKLRNKVPSVDELKEKFQDQSCDVANVENVTLSVGATLLAMATEPLPFSTIGLANVMVLFDFKSISPVISSAVDLAPVKATSFVSLTPCKA